MYNVSNFIVVCMLLTVDWLLSRRHCPQNWPQLALVVREKINVAIQDMPAVEDVAKLLHGTCWLVFFINMF